MQASRGDGHPTLGATLRALAAALTCALGITVLTAAASAPHRDRIHNPVSIVAKTADVTQVAPRTPDLDGVIVDAAVPHPIESAAGPGEATSTATSRTALTYSARGPPAQAAA